MAGYGIIVIGGYVTYIGPGAVDGLDSAVGVVSVCRCVAVSRAVSEEAGLGGGEEGFRWRCHRCW